jgi:hypothetical protein
MTPRIALIAMALVVLPAAALALQGTAVGHCDGADHVVTVSGFYLDFADPEIVGLVFVRAPIGVCGTPVTLPDPPLPFVLQDLGNGLPEYTATLVSPAPAETAVYRYTPYGVRADGGLEPLWAQCDADNRSYALVGCDEVPLARGILALGPNNPTLTDFQVENCPDDCWSEGIGAFLDEAAVLALSGQSAWDLLGRTVDVYGTRTYCTMSGGDYHELTRIVPTAGGACGSVPALPATWGGLKATYR